MINVKVLFMMILVLIAMIFLLFVQFPSLAFLPVLPERPIDLLQSCTLFSCSNILQSVLQFYSCKTTMCVCIHIQIYVRSAFHCYDLIALIYAFISQISNVFCLPINVLADRVS